MAIYNERCRCGKFPDYDGILCKECNDFEIAEYERRITTKEIGD